MHQQEELTLAQHGLDPAAIARVLQDAANAAAAETLPRFRSVLDVDDKGALRFDPVTDADREGERVIRSVIGAAFPDHAIVGEEMGTTGDSRYSWVIDPVDGTRAFICGIPVWGTLIGFAIDGRPRAGIMTQPFIGETFLGLPGESVWLRGEDRKTLAVSGRTELARCRLTTTTPLLMDISGHRRQFDALERQCLTARYGLDCYGYALLASGQIDLVVETGLQPYDIAAMIPIIENAGGVMSTFGGGRPDNGGNVIAAASPQLLDAALSIMNS